MGFKKAAPGDENHQGPGRAIGAPEPGSGTVRSRVVSGCVPRAPSGTVRSMVGMVGLTPFLQTGSLYPSWRTVGKYHWTPDLCLENPRAKPGAFLSRMNLIILVEEAVVVDIHPPGKLLSCCYGVELRAFG